MSDNRELRSKLIRLAATMPKGSQERRALLDVLASKEKIGAVTLRDGNTAARLVAANFPALADAATQARAVQDAVQGAMEIVDSAYAQRKMLFAEGWDEATFRALDEWYKRLEGLSGAAEKLADGINDTDVFAPRTLIRLLEDHR